MKDAEEEGERVLARLAERFAPHGPPVILLNKSHSGSRLLARLFLAAGVELGAERNESQDAHRLLRIVRPLVERHYPDYAAFFRKGDPEIEALIVEELDRHVAGCEPGKAWGWKLCETLYILPVLARIFPAAHFVHLIRDGRDVAFSDHVAPVDPFWRKVYFDSDRIVSWNRRPLTEKAYRRAPHIFNARHWVNSVTVARHYGSMIGAKYHEVRYEELVGAPAKTARALFGAIGLDFDESTLARFAETVDPTKVGKHLAMPYRRRSEAEEVLRPTLEAFGYGLDEGPLRRRWRWPTRV
jgi:hypothetical protein